MFITESTLQIIAIIYILILIIFSLLIIRNKELNTGDKVIKLLILFLIPLLGIVILSFDFSLDVINKKKLI